MKALPKEPVFLALKFDIYFPNLINMSFLVSTNLITDLKFKQKVGVKADAHIESLAVINQEDIVPEQNLRIDPESRPDIQINAKLFLKSFQSDLALEALHTLKNALGKIKNTTSNSQEKM